MPSMEGMLSRMHEDVHLDEGWRRVIGVSDQCRSHEEMHWYQHCPTSS